MKKFEIIVSGVCPCIVTGGAEVEAESMEELRRMMREGEIDIDYDYDYEMEDNYTNERSITEIK